MRWVVVAGAMAMLMVTTGVVRAVPVSLYYQVLNGGKHSSWDPLYDDGGCELLSGYAGVSDGWIGVPDQVVTDGFDGGAVLGIDGTGFTDPDDVGDKAGESLAVGPRGMSGLRVSRVDRAMPTSPTLRTLIALRNKGGKPKTVEITWDSDLGSDAAEDVRRSASGDALFGPRDRWVVSSDSDTTPSDPVVTHVLFGKGKVRSRTAAIVNAPSGTGCLTVRSRARIPGKRTRYLLFFTEMNTTHAAAFHSARKFDKKGLTKALLRGIPRGVRARILNWKLT